MKTSRSEFALEFCFKKVKVSQRLSALLTVSMCGSLQRILRNRIRDMEAGQALKGKPRGEAMARGGQTPALPDSSRG